MRDETSLKWHEIILQHQRTEPRELPFLGLYREYADALKEKEAAKRGLDEFKFASNDEMLQALGMVETA